MEQEKYVCKYMEQHGNEVMIMALLENLILHHLEKMDLMEQHGILELLHLQPPTTNKFGFKYIGLVQFQLKYMCPTTTNNNNY